MASVTVDVSLDEFGEDEILEYAYDIIEREVSRDRQSKATRRIAALFAIADGLPPPSAAALIKHSRDLELWRSGEWQDPRLPRKPPAVATA